MLLLRHALAALLDDRTHARSVRDGAGLRSAGLDVGPQVVGQRYGGEAIPRLTRPAAPPPGPAGRPAAPGPPRRTPRPPPRPRTRAGSTTRPPRWAAARSGPPPPRRRRRSGSRSGRRRWSAARPPAGTAPARPAAG